MGCFSMHTTTQNTIYAAAPLKFCTDLKEGFRYQAN